jgi:hypothetical protein
METLALLLGSSIDQQGLSWSQTFSWDSGLIWDWIVFSRPRDMSHKDISIDREMADGREWNSVLVLLDFLLVSSDGELNICNSLIIRIENYNGAYSIIVSSNAKVNIVAFLVRIRLAFLLL